MTSKFDELVAKLTEIFQIDKPELDFGVYKILHARADEIKDFLTNKLKARVQATLQSHGNATAQASFDAANDKGISHCFKYLTLESYEDTLNNLELKRTGVQEQGLLQFKDDAYLLKYMLDVESRGSIISTDDFRKLVLNSVLLTPTPYQPDLFDNETEDSLAKKHLFFMQDGASIYIPKLFAAARKE